MKATTKLRELLEAPGVIQAAGVADAGQALLVEKVGYPAVYMSGSYVNHTRGFPDGTLTLSEIAARVREIADRVSIPVIADADEGFGGILKIIRTVHEFESAGAAALHLEDMAVKKHGQPMPIPQMVKHLKAALDARSDPDLVIIARNDSMAPWCQKAFKDFAACEQDAFERSVAYAEAGADVVMPLYPSMEWLKRFGREISKPLLLLTPPVGVKELEPYNVKTVIYPVDMLSRSYRFMKTQYAEWLAAGQVVLSGQDQIDRAEANVLVGYPEKEQTLAKYEE